MYDVFEYDDYSIRKVVKKYITYKNKKSFRLLAYLLFIEMANNCPCLCLLAQGFLQTS